MSNGSIFFDNNTLGEIERLGAAAAIRSSLRAANLTPLATEINLLESVSAPGFRHARLSATLASIAGDQSVLPWTFRILQLAGEAHLRGERTFPVPLSALTLEATEVEREELRKKARAFCDELDTEQRNRHAEARPELQAWLKARGSRPAWDELPGFLDWWGAVDVREIFAAKVWEALGLPGEFPVRILTESESWRLLADGEGVAVFQGAVAFEQRRQVQRMDLLQLPYLGGTNRRILVTSDGPFAEAARAVVSGRYLLARVMTLGEFFDSIGFSRTRD